jgi:cell wall-associated NlpC family hydrolase
VARPQSCVRHARDQRQSTGLSTGSGRSRVRGRIATALLLGTTATLTLTVLPGSAAAAPSGPVTRATTADEATELVTEATHQLEVTTEALNEAQEVLTTQRAAADTAAKAVADAQAQRDALDTQMRQVARSAFTGENLSRFNALMTSGSADEFLSQVTTLDAIADHSTEVLTQVTAAAAAAQQAQAGADAAATAAQQTLDQVTAQQSDLRARIADYQAQYDALSAAQQQEVVQAQAGPVLAPPTATTSAPTTAAVRAAAPTAVAPTSVAAGSEAAQTAVDTALAQLGDPYVWGAAGPASFDCSGLTQYAYAAAGVSLPHSSRLQSTMGTPVSRADLQPGDLVFFYSPVSHVGMYIGSGKMVHASTSGSPVLVTSVDMSGYVGARRLLG